MMFVVTVDEVKSTQYRVELSGKEAANPWEYLAEILYRITENANVHEVWATTLVSREIADIEPEAN